MDDFDLLLNPLASADEDTSIDLTGTINNLNAPGSEVTLDIDWGDSTTETVSVVDGGSGDADGAVNGAVDFSVSHIYDEDGSFTIDVDAQEQIVSGTDAVFVVDVSGSAGGGSGIDVDNDGFNDSILDAEVAAFKALNQNLIDRGLGNSANVSVVAYSSFGRLLDLDPATPGTQTFTTPLADADGNGVRDVDQALDGLFAGGGTNFTNALNSAIQAINNAGTPPGGGTVVFLSDGFGSLSGNSPDTIRNDLGQNLRAFGVGPNSGLSTLQQIDPNAVQFSDIQDLLDLFDGTGGGTVNNSDSESVEITINDVPDTPPIPNPVFNPLNPVDSGTEGNDGIVGTDAADLIEGLGGNDAIEGKAGGDEINGGDGTDTAVYQFDPAGVTVDLGSGTATDGYGDTDTLISIENIIGSDSDDNLIGDGGNNNLTGRDGDDVLEGEDGNDFLLGGAGIDFLDGGAGNDTFLYQFPDEGSDTIANFEVGSDKITIVGAIFPGDLSSGVPSESSFFEGSIAVDANDRFGYDASTGDVLFDEDGAGGADAQVLATLSNTPAFTNADILVI